MAGKPKGVFIGGDGRINKRCRLFQGGEITSILDWTQDGDYHDYDFQMIQIWR